MITKNMVAPSSRWLKVRTDFERLYDEHIKDYFLDVITTAYIVREAELDEALKGEIRALRKYQ